MAISIQSCVHGPLSTTSNEKTRLQYLVEILKRTHPNLKGILNVFGQYRYIVLKSTKAKVRLLEMYLYLYSII